MPIIKKSIGDQTLIIEEGKLAKFSNGAVLVRYGDSVILATAVVSDNAKEDIDFFPLVVEYRERSYAAGKIPGGFFKREGKPSEKEVITARLIDRPIRPLFPKGFRNEVQIMTFVLSSDQENDGDVLSIIGASAALSISKIPFDGPIGAVRVGRVDNEFIINPTNSQLDESDMDLVIVGREDKVIMLEGAFNEVSEEDVVKAIEFSKDAIRDVINMQNELVGLCGKKKCDFTFITLDEKLLNEVILDYSDKLIEANYCESKEERKHKIEETNNFIIKKLLSKYPDKKEDELKEIVNEASAKLIRKEIINSGKRPDGRTPIDIRDITCEVGILPRTHGSALFTRGQTQALVVTTLGTADDVKIIDDLEGYSKKKYMLHYNFPPFATGETRPVRGPGRREIGHGVLAEKSLLPIIPKEDHFPYTIQVVSDILESNGSSSMASVCGASLSLMDAGIPVKCSVAGIAMGLIMEGEKYKILTDIQGVEDHYGDMDFKIAGTRKGITAVQLDLKAKGINTNIITETLIQAKGARFNILDIMDKTLSSNREDLSEFAPRIVSINVSPDKVKDVIGPGGKTIKKIIEDTGVSIDVEQSGKLNIASNDPESVAKAISIIKDITQEPEVGKIYNGKVTKIADFGAFVEIFPGTSGLVHISQISEKRIGKVGDVLKEGDNILVKILNIENGRIRLSHKQAVRETKKP